jgi:hypothetical protein
MPNTDIRKKNPIKPNASPRDHGNDEQKDLGNHLNTSKTFLRELFTYNIDVVEGSTVQSVLMSLNNLTKGELETIVATSCLFSYAARVRINENLVNIPSNELDVIKAFSGKHNAEADQSINVTRIIIVAQIVLEFDIPFSTRWIDSARIKTGCKSLFRFNETNRDGTYIRNPTMTKDTVTAIWESWGDKLSHEKAAMKQTDYDRVEVLKTICGEIFTPEAVGTGQYEDDLNAAVRLLEE